MPAEQLATGEAARLGFHPGSPPPSLPLCLRGVRVCDFRGWAGPGANTLSLSYGSAVICLLIVGDRRMAQGEE